jgi:hypothetical protein
MSFHVFHGSEDGTYVPTDDGLSATIAAGPRAPSTSPLSVRNNPLLVQPVLLEEMDAEGLCIYLTNLVKDAELVGDIRERLGDLGGRRWTELLSAMPDGQSFCMLREDLKIANRFVVAELLVDVAHAHARMTTSVRAGAAYAIAPGRDAHGQHLGAGALGEGARHTNSELSSSLSVFGALDRVRLEDTSSPAKLASSLGLETALGQDTNIQHLGAGAQLHGGSVNGAGALDRVRLEDMPSLAKLQASDQTVSSLGLEKYRISLSSWLSAHCCVMAHGVDQIITTPMCSLEAIYLNLLPSEVKFDCRTGSKFFASAHTSIQNMLLGDSTRRHNGSESLLRMIQTISRTVNFQCEERTALMLEHHQNDHPPVSEPADLEAAVLKYVNAYGVWQRISTVDCVALYKVGLQGLMKLLYLRADMIAPLIAPVGQWVSLHPGDSDQFLHIVKVCARKLTLWPREALLHTDLTVDEAAEQVHPMRTEDKVPKPALTSVPVPNASGYCVYSVVDGHDPGNSGGPTRGTLNSSGQTGGTNGSSDQTGGTDGSSDQTRGIEHKAQYDLPEMIRIKTAERLKAAGSPRG